MYRYEYTYTYVYRGNVANIGRSFYLCCKLELIMVSG